MGNILIVEHYRTLGSFYKEILEEDGHSVFVALSGKEALKLISEQHIDVVIVEDGLPDFNTKELLNEIKHLQPHIEGIICTSTDLFAPPQTDLCNENIPKSSDFTILQEEIKRLLRKSSKAGPGLRERLGLNNAEHA